MLDIAHRSSPVVLTLLKPPHPRDHTHYPGTMRFFPVLLLVALFASAFGFVPKAPLMQKAAVAPRARAMKMMEESTYWEGKAPPSKVLGIIAGVPSGILGPASLVALAVGSYSVHESNIFHTLTVDTINPAYVLGSLLTPISWGLHVAAWIQKQNGK